MLLDDDFVVDCRHAKSCNDTSSYSTMGLLLLLLLLHKEQHNQWEPKEGKLLVDTILESLQKLEQPQGAASKKEKTPQE